MVDSTISPAFRLEDVENNQIDFEIIVGKINNDNEQVLVDLDELIEANNSKIKNIDAKIDRLSNHADKIDYIVAIASGVLAAVVDSLWVGEFSLEAGKAWSNKTVNDFVMKVAKSQGYSGDRLDGAINSLENKFKIPSDNVWKIAGGPISTKSHHLDDLAHHPTPIGLFFSILTQFTKNAYFQDSHGEFLRIQITDDGLIGTDIKTKLFAGTVNWFFHLVSDMSGSHKTAGVGMGIPGPIVSMLKEFSMLPGVKGTKLPAMLRKAYAKDHIDLRTEMAVLHQIGKQAVPVIINEIIVRAFYFIRRLYMEIKEKGSWKTIEWGKTMPFNNRTIARMLTIATGTFTACDIADAAIRSGGFENPQILLRINYVGIGRFAIAVYTDVKMGVQKNGLRKERMALMSQQIILHGAKILYLENNTWTACANAGESFMGVYEEIIKTKIVFCESVSDIARTLKELDKYMDNLDGKTKVEIADILKY